jgi:cell division protein ZapA
MPGNTLQLDVSILGREYRVACAEDEQAELLEAVALLDARMREIRDKGRTGGVDRIAVMAALNIANELLRERKKPSRATGGTIDAPVAQRRIRDMGEAIDKALAGQSKLF